MGLQELIDRLNHVREVVREHGFEGSDLEVMFERGSELVAEILTSCKRKRV